MRYEVCDMRYACLKDVQINNPTENLFLDNPHTSYLIPHTAFSYFPINSNGTPKDAIHISIKIIMPVTVRSLTGCVFNTDLT